MKTIALLAGFLACAGFAHGHTHTYESVLSGASENIPNSSAAIGTAKVTLDLDLITMRVEIDITGLSGTTTNAYLYGKTPFPLTGVSEKMSPALTASGFPVGTTSAHYDFTFDLTTSPGYDPDFITASGGTVSDALNALIAGFEEQRVYLGIRTTEFPDGEIRGFFTEVLGPAPALEMTASPDAAGMVLLSAIGPDETASVLQTSIDLVNWTDVETINFTGVPQPVTYQGGPQETQRYFRLRSP